MASHGFEESMFEDLSCFWTVKNAPGIWMGYGEQRAPIRCTVAVSQSQHKKPLIVDDISIPHKQDDSFTRFSSILRVPTRDGVSVHVTVQARVFAVLETIGQTTNDGAVTITWDAASSWPSSRLSQSIQTSPDHQSSPLHKKRQSLATARDQHRNDRSSRRNRINLR